jgi:biotin transport system substrate-specific component
MKLQARALTLRQAVFPWTGLMADVVLIAAFAVITAVAARVTVPLPFSPVPITGQTFAVLLAGAVLGSNRGALSQIAYLAIGATGIPFWFAATTPPGVAALMGPTGGYLVGFVVAAFAIGWLAERGWDRRFWTAALAMLVGNVVIYAFGLPRLAFFVPADKVLALGLIPFIPGDVIKLFLAAAALPTAWRLVRRPFTL